MKLTALKIKNIFPKKSLFRRLLAVFLAFLVIGTSVLIFFRPNEAQAAWFDDNYAYRQPFSFTHNANITSERAITFSLDTAELITDGVMQADCDDTRFTDINGKLLRFQLTGTCNNAATTYEVVFSSVFNGTNPAFVYYGNPHAISASQNVASVTALTPSGGDPAITARTSEEKAPSANLYLKFDEGIGSITQDATANNNDGAVVGSTWKQKELCLFENCLLFDGIDDRVIATNAASIDMDQHLAGGFTYQAWVRVNSDGEGSVGQIFNKGANTYARITNEGADGLADLEVKIDLTTDENMTFANVITLNKWQHIAVGYTDDGDDEATVYINGVSITPTTDTDASGAPAADSNDLLIGGPNSAHFHGFIDEFKVYPVERTSDQLKTEASKIPSLHGKSASFGDDQSYLSEGLVGYWKMDDGVGTPCPLGVDKACDSSGNNNTGTWTNGVASTSGKFGFATNYDGVNDYVNAPGVSWSSAGGPITISFWNYVAAGNGGGSAFTVGNDNSRLQSHAPHSDNVLYWDYGDNLGNGRISTSYSGYFDAWTLVTLVSEGNGGKWKAIYLNGKLANSAEVSDGTDVTLSGLHIGAWPSDNGYHKGKIDDFRLYNRALSSSEVASLYDWGPGPINHWTFDERIGTTANDLGSQLNNGTLTGGPSWTSGKLGQALKFDGVDDRVVVTGAFASFPKDISVSLWVYLDSLGARQDLVNAAGDSIGLTVNSVGGFSGFFDGGPGWPSTSGPTLETKRWYHLVYTLDDSHAGEIGIEGRTYVNGRRHSASSKAESISWEGGGTTFIGAGVGGTTDKVNGRIDDVRFYNYSLTPKQVVSIMNAGHPAVGSPVGSAVGHWKFDEGANNTCSGGANDVCNSSPEGTALDGTSTALRTNQGKFGKALDFDGTDDVVTIPLIPAIDFDTGLASGSAFSAWVNADSDGEGNVGQVYFKDTARYLRVDNESGINLDVEASFNLETTAATVNIPSAITIRTWNHIVVNQTDDDDDEIDVYINGKLAGSSTNGVGRPTGSGITDSDPILIGGLTNANFDGKIDEFKVYNYALTADEIKVEYNQSKAVVMGALSTDPDGFTASNSAERAYCPPGNAETNCAAGLNPAPVGHWPLDERTGTTANDIGGNNNIGTLTGGPTWSTGKLGQALSFDGVNDYVDIDTVANDLQSGNVSLSLWFKPASTFNSANTVDQRLLTVADASSTNDMKVVLAQNDGSLSFDHLDSGGVERNLNSTATSWSGGTWYHVAGTFEGGVVKKLYINGIEDASTASNLTRGSTFSLQGAIGAVSDGTLPFNGIIDDVRVYNYARSPAQVAWDYNRGAPVGHWKLDECTGARAYDSSGKDNHGTITIGASGSNTSAGNCSTVDTATAWYNGRNGKYNSSLNFDGVNDYVDIDTVANDLQSGNVSLSLWFKPASTFNSANTVDQRLLTVADASSTNDMKVVLAQNDGSLSFDHLDSGGVERNLNSTATSWSGGTWYHVAGTFEGGVVKKLYINGIEDASTASNLTRGSTFSLQGAIGAVSDGTLPFNGIIDDVRVYNYALNATQIKTLYNENSAVRFGPLTGSP